MDVQPPDLAAALTQAAETINSKRSLEDTLEAIVRSARLSVAGLDHAGISIRHRDGSIETLAGTDQLVWELDDLQYRLHEGPCVDAIEGTPVVVVEHARHEQRWPHFIPEAVRRGLRAQIGLRLYADQESLGGLNLYSTEAETIDPGVVHVAELFASHAALALGRARQEHHLNQALVSRTIIGQAIGILMERFQIDEDRAFQFLVRTSSTSQVKLRAVAQEVVDSHNARVARGT